MKLSLHWLKRYVDLPESPEELDRIVTGTGLEMEGIEDRKARFDGIVVGHVVTCEKHPKADKLSICTVDSGSGMAAVICGAPNVAAGQKVPFATEGAWMHTLGFRIEKKAIRGIESSGMICSAKELGLNDDHSGIMVLPDHAQTGTPIAELLGMTDVIFDIGITPNRGDALSHVGIARDLAAVLSRELRIPEPLSAATVTRENVRVTIKAPTLCPRYSAAIIRGITLGASPAWLKNAVESVGMRSINTVVDITNFVMMEIGQPMHAFDLSALAGPSITVRDARPGEGFVTLDGKSHVLPPSAVLICDAEKPVAIGGIMGGANSEIRAGTTDILLESAYFNPSSIRKTAKLLGVSTESSYRFERATDPERTMWALRRAIDLIIETSGGLCTGTADVYPHPDPARVIDLRLRTMDSLLGISIDRARATEILRALGCTVIERVDVLSCTAPTFRSDLEREVDLIEEVARIHGYDNIPTPARMEISTEEQYDDEAFLSKLRSAALSLGMDEMVSSSLVQHAHAQLLGENAVVSVLNPVSADRPSLRTSLLPSMLEAADRNIRVGVQSMRLFEIGSIFSTQSSELEIPKHHEGFQFAFAITGLAQTREWFGESRPYDFFDLKGFVHSLLEKLRMETRIRFSPDAKNALSKYSLAVETEGRTCGRLMEISGHVLKEFNIEQPVFYAEFDVETLTRAGMSATVYQAPSKFPTVERDLAFLFPVEVLGGDIVDEAMRAGAQCLTAARILDVFRHESFGEDWKSIAITLSFQSADRTLTEAEVANGVQSIVAAITARWNATLRS